MLIELLTKHILISGVLLLVLSIFGNIDGPYMRQWYPRLWYTTLYTNLLSIVSLFIYGVIVTPITWNF